MIRSILVASLLSGLAFVPQASASSRTFLCLFETDSAELSPRCEQVIRDYAFWWGQNGGCGQTPTRSRTEIEGHADAEEDARGVADQISAARAQAVSAFLHRLCMSADTIVERYSGARRPMAPAEPNTPERQNRRVDIVLRAASG